MELVLVLVPDVIPAYPVDSCSAVCVAYSSCHLAFMYQMLVIVSSQPALFPRRSTCHLARLSLDMSLAGAGKHAWDLLH